MNNCEGEIVLCTYGKICHEFYCNWHQLGNVHKLRHQKDRWVVLDRYLTNVKRNMSRIGNRWAGGPKISAILIT